MVINIFVQFNTTITPSKSLKPFGIFLLNSSLPGQEIKTCRTACSNCTVSKKYSFDMLRCTEIE